MDKSSEGGLETTLLHCTTTPRWGDWRPHLAMILANPLPDSDLHTRSMTTLGDSLMAKGQLFAAQVRCTTSPL